jgi:hypothetical protein
VYVSRDSVGNKILLLALKKTLIVSLNQYLIYIPANSMQTSKYISSILPLQNTLCITSSGGLDIADFNRILFNYKVTDYISCTKTKQSLIYYSVKNEFRILDSKSKPRVSVDTSSVVVPYDVTVFDVSDNIVALGSTLKDQESHISFYDFRNLQKPITVFNDVHSDDITALTFLNDKALLSGSTDGLINVFNLSSFDEDQDLHTTIKYDSVHKIGYFSNYIWAISHMETLGVFTIDGDLIKDFGDVRSNTDIDHILGLDYDFENSRLYLNGSTSTNSWQWYHVGSSLEKVVEFSKHDSYITASLLVNSDNVFGITGDEEGHVVINYY